MLEQHLHHREIVLLGRGHEGKGAIEVAFLGVGIGRRGQQQRDDLAAAELGRARQRPLLARRLKMDRPGVHRQKRADRVDVALDAGEIDVVRGAAGQQQLEQAPARTGVGIGVIAKQRDIDRREAELVRDIERGAVVEQELHELGAVGRVLRLRRQVQRRVAVFVGRCSRPTDRAGARAGWWPGHSRAARAVRDLPRAPSSGCASIALSMSATTSLNPRAAATSTVLSGMRQRYCTTPCASAPCCEQELHDVGVAFANGVMQRRKRSHENLVRQRRRLAQQFAHRHFIAAGAGGNHAGAVGVRVGHGCGPVAFRGRGDVLLSAAVGRMALCPRREPKEGTLAINSNA